MKYRWLHLSDLHSVCNDIRTKIMRDALIYEIKELNNQEPFSFILITGDLSDKNQGYENATELINEIMITINLNSDCIFMVPGNHDLDRNIPTNRKVIVEDLWDVDILDKKEDESIKQLIPAQHEFFKTYESILGRPYPLDKIHFSMLFDKNIAIIHFNTAWMCYDSEIESEKLHLGLEAAYNCLDDYKLANIPIKIVIGHHRLSDFKEQVKNSLKSLFKTKNIDLYLGGHCHKSLVVYDPTIETEFCSCSQARAEDYNYPAGFIVGNIDTDHDQSCFLFFTWNIIHSKWMYDYSVEPAKHGKYYLKAKKFMIEPIYNRETIIDFKLFGFPLDYKEIKQKFKIKSTVDYKFAHKDIRPQSQEEWDKYLRDLLHFYDSIIKDTHNQIHIFPIAPIPLLVSIGYLMQNNNSNINIYQYFENEQTWVLDEKDEIIEIFEEYKSNGNKILALALSISGNVNVFDIEDVIGKNYDLLSIKVDKPRLSYLNYRSDVLRTKKIVKDRLDYIYHCYDEIHLFLSSPAGLCIEIGRIIRESMYPNTYIYNYQNDQTAKSKYTMVYNLKKIRDIK